MEQLQIMEKIIKFTPTHEWISLENDIGTVGITVSAQKELGDIVFIDLPVLGMHVHAGDEAVVIESTKAAADIYSPVSGVIIAVNTELKDSLNPLNQSPEKEGWLFQIRLSHPDEVHLLLNKENYQKLIGG